MFAKIQKLRELEEEKNKLLKKLEDIDNCLEHQKEQCCHIMVYLGYNDFLIVPNKHRCLICGKMDDEKVPFEPEYVIHAEDYLPGYDTQDEEQCNEKFDHIQTLAFGLLRENPNMSRKELTTKLNNLIQEGISFRKSKDSSELVKTKKYKNVK